jgi:hypothetical protein
MKKQRAFQLAAVVGIVAVACVLYNVVPRYQRPTLTLEPPRPPSTSALFQADLMADWRPPKGVKGVGPVGVLETDDSAVRDAAAFLSVSGWAAQPHLPLPLGPCTELAAGGFVEESHLTDSVALLRLVLMSPAARDALGPAAAVGSAAGAAGPLAAVASLTAEPELYWQAVGGNHHGGVIVWGSRTTNISFSNGTHRKSCSDRFTARPEEADRALRAFRGRLEEKARQLGADVSDPAETVRDGFLVGFRFNYTLGAASGRVEAVVEPGLARDNQLRLEVEEGPE